MKIDTAGTYTLKYTAEDSCGNVTEVDREVEAFTLRTVMYSDGTLILNEKSTDIEANLASHGADSHTFAPMDENNPYVFSNNNPPWLPWVNTITGIEIGHIMRPISTAYWFSQCANATYADVAKLDTSDVTDMSHMFNLCSRITQLDVSHFNTSKVVDMSYAFASLGVENFDLRNFDTSNVTNMQRMFSNMQRLKTLDISSFDTAKVTNMEGMFISMGRNTFEGALDISSFDTSMVTNMSNMFRNFTRISTIYVANTFDVSAVTASADMFDNATALVGGSGTPFSWNNPTDKTYAHIDGGTSNPGYFTAKPSA